MAFVFTDYKKMTDEDFKRQGLIWTTIDEENENGYKKLSESFKNTGKK